MAKHGERIHKRKDGRWEGRYKIGNREDGRTIYSSVYGKSYAEVKAKLKESEKSASSNPADKQEEKNVSYVLNSWLSSIKLHAKKSTVYKYSYLIEKHILPDLGDFPLSALDNNTIHAFAEKKLESGSLNGKKGLSKSYVKTMLFIVLSALSYSEQEGVCKVVPSKVHKLKIEKNELRILTATEQQKLEKFLVSNLSATALGVLITLQTGLRIGEICALSWDSIDFIHNILRVSCTVTRIKSETKNGTVWELGSPKTAASAREIPFSNELKNLLLIVKKQSLSRFVISDSQEFINPRTFEYRYHKLMKEIDLPDLNFHALRHSFATRCVEWGVNTKSLSEILGHANAAVTLNTYVHSSIHQKRVQLEKLPPLPAC